MDNSHSWFMDSYYNCIPQILGMDGHSFNESCLEEYVANHLVPRYSKELDPHDVGILARIVALLAHCGHLLLREIVGRDGMMDLHKVTLYQCNNHDCCSGKKNDQRRFVTSLTIGQPWKHVNYPEQFFLLLSRLSGLRELTIYGCNSFGLLCQNLSNYSKIQSLSVSVSRHHNADPIACLANQLSSRVPSLESLSLIGHSLGYESELEDFLFEILPSFPKLARFSVDSNKVRTFQSIAQTLAQRSTPLCTSRLRTLDLGSCNDDPYDTTNFKQRELLQTNDFEIEAFCQILRAFPELTIHRRWNHLNIDIGIEYRGSKPCPLHPSIEYLSEINRVGRVLVEKTPVTRGEDDSSDSTTFYRIPLAVWPLVLARAARNNHQSSTATKNEDSFYVESPNGIYYLLRNAPELHSRNARPIVVSSFRRNNNPITNNHNPTIPYADGLASSWIRSIRVFYREWICPMIANGDEMCRALLNLVVLGIAISLVWTDTTSPENPT